MQETLITLLEIIGTAAFAISGAAKAMEKNMDVFGVAMLGLTTATAGGVIRDLILGLTPPGVFSHPLTVLLALAAAVVVFLIGRRRLTEGPLAERILLWMDSAGLAIFSVVGVQTAYTALPAPGFLLLLFVGVITGVGGGILGDVLCGSVPQVFVKHFYACSSLIGTALCALLWRVWAGAPAMVCGAAVILLLRLLAARFRWNLPRAKNE